MPVIERLCPIFQIKPYDDTWNEERGLGGCMLFDDLGEMIVVFTVGSVHESIHTVAPEVVREGRTDGDLVSSTRYGLEDKA